MTETTVAQTVEAVDLWAVHVEGPDDVLAAESRQAVDGLAAEINDAYTQFQARPDASEFDVRWHAEVVPWDGSPETHTRSLSRLEHDGGYLA